MIEPGTGKVLGELSLVQDLGPAEACRQLFRQNVVQLEVARADRAQTPSVASDVPAAPEEPAIVPAAPGANKARGARRR